MLTNSYLALVATLLALKDRVRETARDDDGFTTLEWVVIALGLFVVAGIAVGVIVAAINSRLSGIS